MLGGPYFYLVVGLATFIEKITSKVMELIIVYPKTHSQAVKQNWSLVLESHTVMVAQVGQNVDSPEGH